KEDISLPENFRSSRLAGVQSRIFQALKESDLFQKSSVGVNMASSQKMEYFLNLKKVSPKITPLLSLNSKTEKHYLVEYRNEPSVAKLNVVERQQAKHHEVTVTANTADF